MPLGDDLKRSMAERGVDVEKITSTAPTPPTASKPLTNLKHLEVFLLESRRFQHCRISLLNNQLTNFSVSKSDLTFEMTLTSQDDLMELQRLINDAVNLITK